jgi:hypothetical protein
MLQGKLRIIQLIKLWLINMSMTLYVPEIGDILELEESWTFRLFDESRNAYLKTLFALDRPPGVIEAEERAERARLEYRALYQSGRRGDPKVVAAYQAWSDADESTKNCSWDVTLPATTKLKVARIYIRVGVSAYSSLTFTIVETPLVSPLGKKLKGRAAFWAKLADVNKMVIKKPDHE